MQDWQRRVRTWFDQPARKQRRRLARTKRAAALAPRPTTLLRPAIRCPGLRYNIKIREGRGFSFEELKKAGFEVKKAAKLGIAIDHRRRNTNEESLEMNVQRLNEYKAKLIVFPRKTRGKKGEEKMAVDVITPICWAMADGRNRIFRISSLIFFLLSHFPLLHLLLPSARLMRLRGKEVSM